MPRSTRGALPGGELQAAHLYISHRSAEREAKAGKGDKNHGPYSTIAAYCRAHGRQDDTGSYTWLLPDPVVIDDVVYTGFRLQASQPASYFDDQAARDLITSLGPDAVSAATHTEVIWDLDMLFLFLQQGRITAEALDAVLIMPDRTYSLTVLQQGG